MNDKVRIKMVVETGFAGANHVDYTEVDRSEWEGMSEQQQEGYLDEVATDFRDSMISYSAWVLEEGGDE